MKKLLIGLMALSSLSVFAGALGTPDQDPVIKNVRERFAKAKVPNLEALVLNDHSCRSLSAVRDNFWTSEHESTRYRFKSFDGLIIASDVLSHITMVSNGKELIGSLDPKYNMPGYLAIRETESGDLIIETSQYDANSTLAKSISNDGAAKAYVYDVCVKNKVNTSPNSYRCQLATDFCGYKGGRYGFWVKAEDKNTAIDKCLNVSENRNHRLCKVE
ncbi:MAG: hypothetical protein ACOVP4_10225 [Bacteriovoracaceae bacterium]